MGQFYASPCIFFIVEANWNHVIGAKLPICVYFEFEWITDNWM